jgi:hypothetical protein
MVGSRLYKILRSEREMRDKVGLLSCRVNVEEEWKVSNFIFTLRIWEGYRVIPLRLCMYVHMYLLDRRFLSFQLSSFCLSKRKRKKKANISGYMSINANMYIIHGSGSCSTITSTIISVSSHHIIFHPWHSSSADFLSHFLFVKSFSFHPASLFLFNFKPF